MLAGEDAGRRGHRRQQMENFAAPAAGHNCQQARVGRIASGRLAPAFPGPGDLNPVDFAKLLGTTPAETPATTLPPFMQDERALRELAQNMARARLGRYALGFGLTATGGGLLARQQQRAQDRQRLLSY